MDQHKLNNPNLWGARTRSQHIMQKNGMIVMDALRSFNEPTTIGRLVKRIAEYNNKDPADITNPVKTVLKLGFDSGFVDQVEGRFFIRTDPTVRMPVSSCMNGIPESPSSTGEPEDRCGSKKKRRRRKKKACKSKKKLPCCKTKKRRPKKPCPPKKKKKCRK